MIKEKIDVLVVGKNGGRTHAFLRNISQSLSVGKLYCFPGCEEFAGIAELIDVDKNQIYQDAKDKNIDLVVISSEEDLHMADEFRKKGINVFGPGKKGMQLEASKITAKNFMVRHGIPTSKFFIAKTINEANLAIDKIGKNVVVKAYRFAGGKGVGVFSDINEAKAYAKWLLEGGLGPAGKKLVIEKRLYGAEASVITVVCGDNYCLLPIVQDYKRVGDGDKGPNTGGTGGYGPVNISPAIMKKIKEEIIDPTLVGLRKERIDYRGALYFGIMITPDGKVWLLEYNCRFGDPETEVQMLLLNEDFAAILYDAAIGKMQKKKIAVRKGYAVCVVLMAEGYPGKPVTGDEIIGLESVVQDENHIVFHANTVLEGEKWKTAGGRVLVVVAFAQTLEKARIEAYKMAAKIFFRGMHYRTDIAQKRQEA